MNQLWSPCIHHLQPYLPGEQPVINNIVKLNTNENPYGPSPLAISAMARELNLNLRLYPDPYAKSLKVAIAEYYGLTISQIFVGNGSDEVLAHVFQAFFRHDVPILFPDVTYSFYLSYAALYGVTYRTVALSSNLTICIHDYLNHGKNIGGIIFPNPNAPTGCLLSLSEIKKIIESNMDRVIVVDEAYIDFGGDSAVTLIKYYPNLLVVQTMSKSRSLAGLRVGFAMGHIELIRGLERVKDSFNSYPLDRIAISGATAAIRDKVYFQKTCSAIINSRIQLSVFFQNLGFLVLPSVANFLLVHHPQHDALVLAAALRKAGIIVRHFNNVRIQQFLRITIGTNNACQRLMTFLDSYLKLY